MKHITHVSICLLFFSCTALSQTESSIPQTHLSLPVHIEIPRGSGGSWQGSGFFLGHKKEDLYLVTAKHVLFDTNGGLLGDTATLSVPASDVTDTSMCLFILNLKTLELRKSILTHKTADVALIRLWDVKDTIGIGDFGRVFNIPQSGFTTRAFEMLTPYAGVLLGNEVYVYGYPTSLGLKPMLQFDGRRPLLRKGIVAGKYDSRQTIIIDCPVYGGNSGGPVIQASPVGLGEMKFKIIGIVTEFIPFDVSNAVPFLRPEYFFTNSGYAVVESADRILEILAEEP